MDATITAATPASVPTTYTGGRTDPSKSAGSGFQSALADTSPDRNRGQTASDSSSTNADAASSDATATATSASSTKALAQNDNTAADGNVTSQNALADDADAAAEALAGAPADSSTAATTTSSSTKDASAALAKLMAALARDGNANSAAQDTAATDTATAATDTTKVVKSTTQDLTKVDDQQVLATLIGAEQAAGDTTAAAAGTKTGVKTPSQDKTKISNTDDSKDTAETPKEGAAGIQDALSLLGQASAAQASAAQASLTASQTANTVNADDAAKITIDDKLGAGLATKVKSDGITKTSDTTAQTTAATGTGQSARSSVADALHMVSGSGHSAGSSAEDKLTVADSSSLANADPMQGVDVLDSRRIIAPVSTSNGANIAATMAGDGEWSAAMRSSSASDVSTTDKLTTDKTLNTLSIKMTPESLGNVTANLKLVDGQLTVSLVVENGSAYRKLHEDQSELMKSLKAQGFSVDQIQISIASPEKSTNDASQNNSQNQTSSQQQAQQNSGGFNQGNSRQQAQPGFENYGQTSGGLVDDTTPSGSVGNGSSNAGAGGQLYL